MKTYDLFSNGRWIGMSEGENEIAAREMTKRSLPHLGERFTLIEWHGRMRKENCKASGGEKPDPEPELEWKMLTVLTKTRSIVSEAAEAGFNYKYGDWAERLFANQAQLTDAIKACGGK